MAIPLEEMGKGGIKARVSDDQHQFGQNPSSFQEMQFKAVYEEGVFNAIYEECVCRGMPSIGIIKNSGLIFGKF